MLRYTAMTTDALPRPHPLLRSAVAPACTRAKAARPTRKWRRSSVPCAPTSQADRDRARSTGGNIDRSRILHPAQRRFLGITLIADWGDNRLRRNPRSRGVWRACDARDRGGGQRRVRCPGFDGSDQGVDKPRFVNGEERIRHEILRIRAAFRQNAPSNASRSPGFGRRIFNSRALPHGREL